MTSPQNNPSKKNKYLTDMKLYPQIVLLAALLMNGTACNHELPGEESFHTPTDGMLLIDYSLGAGENAIPSGAGITRAGEDNRINSLHYLVYDIDKDVLVKQREIPGIDQVTSWPLSRQNMTWEQRLALQDTLPLKANYQIVFVANADPKLFSDTQTALLQHTDKYSTASLTLPDAPFTENNLYYLWSHKITTGNSSHDNFYLCNVLLQRIVTRTDVQRMDIPTTEPERDDFTCRMIRESLFEDLTCRKNAAKEEGRIRKEIKKRIQDFQNLTNTAVAGGVLTFFTANVASMNIVLNNEDNIDLIIASLSDQIIRGNLLPKLKNGTLLNKYLQSWNLGANKKAEVHYSTGKRVNSFRLNRSFAGNEGTDNPTYTCPATNGTFSIYAFAANNAADADLNQIEKVSLYDEDFASASGTPRIEIGGTWNTRQDMNTLRAVTCNPIRYIREQGNLTEKTDYTVNLEAVLRNKWDTSLFTDDFKQTMKNVIFISSNPFGTGFTDFSFSLSLPTLDETQGGVSISAEWSWQSNP